MSFSDFISYINTYINVQPVFIRIVISLLIILIGLLFRKIVVNGVLSLVKRLTKKSEKSYKDLILAAAEKPAQVLVFGFSIWLALFVLAFPATIQIIINRIFRTFFIVTLFYFLYKSADSVAIMFERFVNKADKKISPVLISLLRKSLKVVIIVIEIFMIIKEWGFDVTGLITGLGIGGLAISLAAKDAASNLLGSITIMSDRTYDIGDWIQTNDVEGFVEEIGFRSTKIRTFSNALTSVPNSIMSNEPITNWTKMGKRRVKFNLNIPLDTPAGKINIILERIREVLKNHQGVNQEYMVVQLSGIEDSSLQLLVYYFTKTTAYLNYLEVSEDVYLKTLEIFEDIEIPIIPPRRLVVDTNKQIETIK